MPLFTLDSSQTILLIVDVQEKIFPRMANSSEVLHHLSQCIHAFQILNLPIILSEQYPKGLGNTLNSLKNLLGQTYCPWIKSSFSCLEDPDFFNYVVSLPYRQWIVVGIEAHICVLQTAKELIKLGKQVTVLNDAVTSRNINHVSTAIAEMRDIKVRISSTETILFELLKNSSHPHFKSISQLIKT